VSVCLGTVPQHPTAFGVISTPKLQFSPPRHFRDSHNAPCSQHDIWLQSQITQEETSQAADSNLEIFWGIWKERDLSKIGQTSRNRIQHLSFCFPLLSRLSKQPTIWIWILEGTEEFSCWWQTTSGFLRFSQKWITRSCLNVHARNYAGHPDLTTVNIALIINRYQLPDWVGLKRECPTKSNVYTSSTAQGGGGSFRIGNL